MKFLVPGLVSGLAGAVLGAIVVFGITAAVQQNSIPEISHGDPSTSLLDNVQYGSR
ncbi:DUF2613 domain-containing protein [Nocardia thailandica]|uniref:DUF2613 domain-containing protein n=1 Tax=Nocardia thailandica TaxID=257275 RepID=A0ABW6PG45_9NOCA|nr:DUF2613 domain-containing protein [Nocardia thailandica]